MKVYIILISIKITYIAHGFNPTVCTQVFNYIMVCPRGYRFVENGIFPEYMPRSGLSKHANWLAQTEHFQ